MRRQRWADDDADEAPGPVLPEPDFPDPRRGYTEGASVWGAPPPKELAPVEEVLDGVLGRFAGSSRSAVEHVRALWEDVTTPDWSGTRAAAVRDDVLVVEVPDGVTASRLQFQTAALLDGLRDVAGGRLRRVQFRVARR